MRFAFILSGAIGSAPRCKGRCMQGSLPGDVCRGHSQAKRICFLFIFDPRPFIAPQAGIFWVQTALRSPVYLYLYFFVLCVHRVHYSFILTFPHPLCFILRAVMGTAKISPPPFSRHRAPSSPWTRGLEPSSALCNALWVVIEAKL